MILLQLFVALVLNVATNGVLGESSLTSASASVGRPARRYLQIESEHMPCLCLMYIRIVPTNLSCPPCDFATPEDAMRSVRESTERRRLERANFFKSKKVHWSGLKRRINEHSFVPHPPYGRIIKLACDCTDLITGESSLVEGVISASGGACSPDDTTKCVIHEAVLIMEDYLLKMETSVKVEPMLSHKIEEDGKSEVFASATETTSTLPTANGASSNLVTFCKCTRMDGSTYQMDVGVGSERDNCKPDALEDMCIMVTMVASDDPTTVDGIPKENLSLRTTSLSLDSPCDCGNRTVLLDNTTECSPMIFNQLCPKYAPGYVSVPESVKIDFSTQESFCECVEPNGIMQYPKDPQDSECTCPAIEHKDEVIIIVGVLPVKISMRDCDCPPGNVQNVQSVPIEEECPKRCKSLPLSFPRLIPIASTWPEFPPCKCPTSEQDRIAIYEETETNGGCRNGCSLADFVDVITLRACSCREGDSVTGTLLYPDYDEACADGCIEFAEEVVVIEPLFSPIHPDLRSRKNWAEQSIQKGIASARSLVVNDAGALALLTGCPVTMPSAESPCNGIETKTCSYGNECCRYGEADGTVSDCSCGPSYQCTCSDNSTFACLNTGRCLIGQDIGCIPTILSTTTAHPETTTTVEMPSMSSSSPALLFSDCPAVEPAPGSPCNGIETKTCSYGNECCQFRDVGHGLSNCSCGPSFECRCSADDKFACRYTDRCFLGFNLGCTPRTSQTNMNLGFSSVITALTACPAERPVAGSSCVGLEGQQCSYGSECCRYRGLDDISECWCNPEYLCICHQNKIFECLYPNACKFEPGCVPPVSTVAVNLNSEAIMSEPSANNQEEPRQKEKSGNQDSTWSNRYLRGCH